MWLALLTAYANAEPIPEAAGSFKFVDTHGNAERPITVWTYRPEGFVPGGRVVFVMHGQGRDGKRYRDAWVEFAKQQKFLLLTPEFSNVDYPSDAMYQQGYIQAFDGSIRAKEKWSLLAIEHLFDYVVQENSLLAKRYTIYGHSGGGQFVHRLVLLHPKARIELAVAANPGWYTMSDLETEYPYGLKGTPTDLLRLKAAFATPLVILLGENDTDPKHPQLRRTRDAMVQGATRFERGHHFFEQAKKLADKTGSDFKWQMETVPHVGHTNTGMAAAAARIVDQGAVSQSQ